MANTVMIDHLSDDLEYEHAVMSKQTREGVQLNLTAQIGLDKDPSMTQFPLQQDPKELAKASGIPKKHKAVELEVQT